MSDFKKYFTEQFSNHQSCETEVNKIFAALNIQDQTFKNIVTRYQIDDNRFSVIINTLTNRGNIGRVLIDVIEGSPTWFQLKNVNFEIGQRCDTKIIICNDSINSKRDDRYLDGINAAYTLAKIKNDIFIVAYRLSSDDNNEMVATYDASKFISECDKKYENQPDKDLDDEEKENDDKSGNYNLLTRIDMELTEFEIYMDESFGLWNPPILLNPNRWRVKGSTFHEQHFDFSYYWQMDGFYNSILLDPARHDLVFLKWLELNEFDAIYEKYDDCEIYLKADDYKITGIEILVWEKPYADFIRSNRNEKNEILGICFNYYMSSDFFKSLFEKYQKDWELDY